MREQLVPERILLDRAHDGALAGNVPHTFRHLGERLDLAEQIARSELRERHVAGLRLGAEVHAAGGDQVDACGVAPGDEDLVTRGELVELGERFEAVAVLAVELLEALAGREGEHGPPGRLPSCLIPDRAARRQRASRNPMFE